MEDEEITLKQWLKYHRTITKYAMNNWRNREYWKGYKRGWIECINNLLLEAEDNVKLKSKNKEMNDGR